ncbi:hypothetical protein LTR37_013377, partial [Vermiconidia calcicola]
MAQGLKTSRDSDENRQRKTADEILKKLSSNPGYRRSVYFSYCASRDIQGLESLFRQWPSDQFTGSVTKEGDTGVLLAAHEENGLQTLRWLKDRGDPVHLENHYGRTSLIEASLWGRLDIVQYLTQRKVHLQARDSNSMRVAHLAADAERNTTERARRAQTAQDDRSVAETPHRAQPRGCGCTDSTTATSFFGGSSDDTLEVFRHQELFEPPHGPGELQIQKAFATLDRGTTYPSIHAMSGYSYPDWPKRARQSNMDGESGRITRTIWSSSRQDRKGSEEEFPRRILPPPLLSPAQTRIPQRLQIETRLYV